MISTRTSLGMLILLFISLLSPIEASAQKTASSSAAYPGTESLDEKIAVQEDLSSYENMFRLSYTAFLNCYGEKVHAPSCTDKTSADVNDDGVVDEVDYNLIISGFNRIHKQKLMISPTLTPVPTAIPEKPISAASPSISPTIQPTVASSVLSSPSSVSKSVLLTKVGAFGGIISIPAAAAVGVGAAFKKRKKKKK